MTHDDYRKLQLEDIIKRAGSYKTKSFPFSTMPFDLVGTAIQYYQAVPIGATRKKLDKYAKSFNAPIKDESEHSLVIDFKSSIDGMLSEIWVKPDYANYQNEFIKFLNKYYSVNGKIPKCYNVDHFLSKAQLNNREDMYTRLILIEDKANQSHGASFEKAFTQSTSLKNDMINVDAISFLKSIGEKYTKGIKNNNKKNQEAIRNIISDGLVEKEEVAKLILDELFKLAFK